MWLKRWQQWLLLSVYAAVITALSLTPASTMPDITLWDKAQHFIAYAVFVGFAYPVANTLRGRLLFAIAIILYSAAMEYGQSWMPGRAPSGGDLLANSLGVVIAFAIMSAVGAIIKRRRRRA